MQPAIVLAWAESTVSATGAGELHFYEPNRPSCFYCEIRLATL